MSAGQPGGAGYKPARCIKSAPFKPAACTLTSSSPASGCRVRAILDDDGTIFEHGCAHGLKRTRAPWGCLLSAEGLSGSQGLTSAVGTRRYRVCP